MAAYRRYFAQLKSAEDAVQLELSVDISLLLLRVGGFVDRRHGFFYPNEQIILCNSFVVAGRYRAERDTKSRELQAQSMGRD